MNHSPVIAISVGEASGDLLGAHLIRAIKQRRPDAKFIGIGGERMKAEGFESLYDQEKLAVRGFVEVVKRLPEILKIRKGLVNDLITSSLMSLSASTHPISIWAWRKNSKRRASPPSIMSARRCGRGGVSG